MSVEVSGGLFRLSANLPAGVRLARAAVPTNSLTKGRQKTIPSNGLVLSQALGHGHANGLVLLSLDTALADGHDARLDLPAHVDLERGALE